MKEIETIWGIVDTRFDNKSKFESGDITIQGAKIDVK
jgi:hypothetical protein